YAYVANPMQLSAVITLLAWGLFLRSCPVAAGAVMVVIYSVGFADWDERRDLAARYGDRWVAYRREVRNWWPRWRPHVTPRPDAEDVATLYVAFTCGQCSQLGAWFEEQEPVGLRIAPAEEHPCELERITYSPPRSMGEGWEFDDRGVAAVG